MKKIKTTITFSNKIVVIYHIYSASLKMRSIRHAKLFLLKYDPIVVKVNMLIFITQITLVTSFFSSMQTLRATRKKTNKLQRQHLYTTYRKTFRPSFMKCKSIGISGQKQQQYKHTGHRDTTNMLTVEQKSSVGEPSPITGKDKQQQKGRYITA